MVEFLILVDDYDNQFSLHDKTGEIIFTQKEDGSTHLSEKYNHLDKEYLTSLIPKLTRDNELTLTQLENKSI